MKFILHYPAEVGQDDPNVKQFENKHRKATNALGKNNCRKV